MIADVIADEKLKEVVPIEYILQKFGENIDRSEGPNNRIFIIEASTGSGKTTIGHQVFKYWKEIDQSTVFIDGDKIREIFKHDKGESAYTKSGRRLNAERI